MRDNIVNCFLIMIMKHVLNNVRLLVFELAPDASHCWVKEMNAAELQILIATASTLSRF